MAAIFAVMLMREIGWAALFLLLLIVPAAIAGFALAAKRLHDRDKSAWWILLFYFVPGILDQVARASGEMGIVFWLGSFAISMWALVELGFLRGTEGTNRFGPDPVARPLYA